MRRLRKIALEVGLIALITVLACEAGLQIAASYSKPVSHLSMPPFSRGENPKVLEGEDGLMRGNPSYPSHDENGYRNASVPENATIVTLGDSHTYGTLVQRDEAWPRLLAEELGVSLYNMGLGTYGAMANAMHLEDALQFQPKIVVLGFYFGNDLVDDFNLSRSKGTLFSIVGQELAQEALELEASRGLGSTIPRLFEPRRSATDEDSSDVSVGNRALWSVFPTMGRWLGEHSRVLGAGATILEWLNRLIRGPSPSIMYSRNFADAAAAIEVHHRAFVTPFEGGGWRTLLTGPYRLIAEDLSDPRIRAGFEVSKASIGAMAENLAQADVRFVVVLLPTKEFVFWPKIASPADLPGMVELYEAELHARESLKDYLAPLGVILVDPVDALRESSVQPYFENADGHPNPHGHWLIMQELKRKLASEIAQLN